MPLLTIKAQVHADRETEAVLRDAMFCATKVFNGLLWHLRQEFEQTGRSDIRRSNLNRVLATLPRAKGYYSMSALSHRPGGEYERIREVSITYDKLTGRLEARLVVEVKPRENHNTGRVARPVVLSFQPGWHTVHEPKRKGPLRASA